MKFKLIPAFLFALIFFSCKNESKNNNTDLESSQPKTETIAQDSIKTDSSIVSTTNDVSQSRKQLLDFYIKNDKKAEFFLINNAKDTTIICREKTKITIKANSFSNAKTGTEVKGQIKISVKEYYNISDILLGRLSTISNGKLLETGGMLDINAFSNQEKCELQKGKSIEIEMPKKTQKEGMQLFNGNWKNDQMNWQVAEISMNINQVFTKADEMPVYPGGNQKLYKFIGNNFRIPDEEGLSGKIYSTFVVDKEGNVTDIKIKKGLSKKADEEAIRVIKLLPKFTPGKINGIPVNVFYSLPITIHSEDDDSRYSSSTSSNGSGSNYVIKKTKAEEFGSYLFKSGKLGFINCDRFLDYDQSSLINYVINFKNDSNTSISIVFHSMKSVVTGYANNDSVSFRNIPSGQKITIFAIKYFNNKPYLTTQETETSKQKLNNLTFEEVTPEKLKEEIIKLNRLN